MTAMRWFCDVEADMQLTLAKRFPDGPFAAAHDLE